jgi:DNA invertase Pin-like site-specific DNA recombinase
VIGLAVSGQFLHTPRDAGLMRRPRSTHGRFRTRQLDALKAASCRRVFADKQSGRDTGRPELTMCLAFMAAGDTLVVPSLDRLSRSLHDLITIVGGMRRQGVGFTSLHENLDTTTPGGRLVFHVFAALAEFIRELIVSGTREGLAAARPAQRCGVPVVRLAVEDLHDDAALSARLHEEVLRHLRRDG